MEECCDDRNMIFSNRYVCINCGVIHGYRYIDIFMKFPFMKMKII